MTDNSFKLRYKNVPAAIYIKDGNEDTILHNHPEVEVLIIDSGSSCIKIGKDIYNCKAGDLVIVNPMEVHSISINKENMGYRHKCICFDTELINDKKFSDVIKNEELRFKRYISSNSEDNVFLRDCVEKAIKATEENKPASYLKTSAYISLFVGCMTEKGFTEEVCRKERKDKNDKFIKECLAYINLNFSKGITSNDIANELNYNHSYFCRRFKSEFGRTFTKYLNIYRIVAAKQMMEENERKKISDIAYECGFSDSVYFSRCFKEWVGVVPSEYYKNHK